MKTVLKRVNYEALIRPDVRERACTILLGFGICCNAGVYGNPIIYFLLNIPLSNILVNQNGARTKSELQQLSIYYDEDRDQGLE